MSYPPPTPRNSLWSKTQLAFNYDALWQAHKDGLASIEALGRELEKEMKEQSGKIEEIEALVRVYRAKME
jgi:hypothetical protein